MQPDNPRSIVLNLHVNCMQIQEEIELRFLKIGILLMGFLAAILNWNFRLQNSDF